MRLTLRLGEGQIDGEGDDCIGRFTFRGGYNERGHVTMVKQYVGKHRLLYEGSYDGEGTIFGRWTFSPTWTGPFALKLEAAEADEQEIAEIVPATVAISPVR
jgi:hypothetical protein